MRHIFRFALSSLAFLTLMVSFSAPLRAQEDPRVVLDALLDDLQTLWVPLNRQASAPYASRRAWTQNLVNNRFDFEHMVVSSMGVRWARMSDQQQATYRALFADALVEIAIDWLDGYNGQNFEVLRVQDTGRNTEVRTLFEYANGNTVQVVWITRQSGGRYLVRDIRVAGLSLVADFRGRYRTIIERDGFEGFFESLAADTAALNTRHQ